MSRTSARRRILASFLPLALGAWAGGAWAIDFNVLGNPMKFENLITVGGLMRMQGVDPSLIGKSSLNPGICVGKDPTPGDPTPVVGGPDLYDGDTCTTSSIAANERFVHARGSYSPNGDNGDMSFDKYDLVMATAKWTMDFSWSFADYNLFMRGMAFYDQQYNGYSVHHRDTTFQSSESGLREPAQRQMAWDYDLLDYNVSHVFSIPGIDRDLSVKVGNQVLNWGESSFLLSNSLNAINPPDQTRLRVPGFDLKELLQPEGMVVFGADIVQNLSFQGFYQYEWKPVIVDPPGTYFSQSDTLGTGGKFSMLSFAKAPEDPKCKSRPIDNSDDSANPNDNPAGEGDPLWTLGSTACRTVYRDSDREQRRRPDKYGGDQGGMKLTYFAESFNNGTEFAFYFANYTSRFPVVSAVSSDATCLDSTIGAASLVSGCGYTGPGKPDAKEPLPVNTARVIVEYPKNIQLYGVSFNTTVGDFALSGEYAFRPNLPTQIHTTDLLFAALQPAFPDNDFAIPGTFFGLPISEGVSVIPGRRSAVPDFITQYRHPGCANDCIGPNQYIRGYERMKTGQANLTVLKLFGGDNPIGASQITMLLETGLNHVMDFPSLDQLQFNGAGTDTHISNGADGTKGIEPPDIRNNPDGQHEVPDTGPGTDCASPENPVLTTSMVNPRCLRQNPTAHRDWSGFGTQYSWGYRFVFLPRWDDAIFGANVEFLGGFFHDVEGTTPGIGGNFVEGRRNILAGLRFDYLSRWIGEVRYTWFTGGKNRDQLRDRDNLFVYAGFLF